MVGYHIRHTYLHQQSSHTTKSIKGFTLIEIIVVLLIVMLLLTTVLRTSHNFSRNLEFKNQKEEFVGLFQTIVSTAMSSNHTRQGIFTGITMEIGGDTLTYIDTDIHAKQWLGLQFSALSTQANIVAQVPIKLQLIPYTLGCKSLNPSSEQITFMFSQSDSVKACFRIDLPVCKLIEISCNNTPPTPANNE